ncbi:hypothetical protein MMC17_005696 [Xylographa soralifera]|nr:hypothetical protein [Xylographa soralifera]
MPNCGQRLLPTVIDFVARDQPDRVFGVYPKVNTDLTAGFEEVTFSQYANAINSTAWWLAAEKKKTFNGDTLAYLGPNDFRHAVVAIAANKVGLKVNKEAFVTTFFVDCIKVLFLSPRNSLQGHLNLLKATDCRTLITSNPSPPFAKALLSSEAIQVLYMRGQNELFQGDVAPTYAFTKTFEEARNDPFIVLHTSGSTGLPKPVIWTHGYIAALDKTSWAAPPIGFESALRKMFNMRILNSMPAFHAGGAIMIMCLSVFCGLVSVLPPSHKPLDATTVAQILRVENVQTCVLLPSILEDIAKDSLLIKEFEKFPYVFNSGGPLSKTICSAFKDTTQIINLIGTTETGVLPHLFIPDIEDSMYVALNPCAGAEFRPHSHNLYELVLVRTKEVEDYQPVWHVFPKLYEYSPRDLFSKHPRKPDLWTHVGRADDIVVFANGEKVNPVTTETLIQSHPEVRAALVIGEGRNYPALLIEPTDALDTVAEKAIILESLWPSIEKANLECPAHGKIGKSLVFFTNPAKPMLRAGKGTVQRKLTLEAYATEINEVYADADRLSDGSLANALDMSTDESLRVSLNQVVSQLVGLRNLKADNDLFAQGGMDSLQVLKLTACIKAALGKMKINTDSLAPSIVYTHPTIERLSALLSKLITRPTLPLDTDQLPRTERMKILLEIYTSHLPPRRISSTLQEDSHVVILTGSTGALGSYILAVLSEHPRVTKIYCLNRTSGSERQRIIAKSRGLPTHWNTDTVAFLECNLSEPNLGLSASTFAQIHAEATLIIHNAWPVDFNLSLASFSPQIRGVRALIDFAAQSAHNARIFFISSIASMLRWGDTHGRAAVPESIVSDPALPSATGYAEAKYVAEQLLHRAQTESDIATSVCRVGQIAGPVLRADGEWSRREWFPSMVTSSKHLRVLPSSLGETGRVDWVPIDLLAQIVAELALRPRTPRAGTEVYHALNPRATTWARLLPAVRSCLGPEVQVVSFADWLGALRASARAERQEREWEVNPALKLLGFFEMLGQEHAPPVFETDVTEGLSATMRGLQAIQEGEMRLWMRQWGFEVRSGEDDTGVYSAGAVKDQGTMAKIS